MCWSVEIILHSSKVAFRTGCTACVSSSSHKTCTGGLSEIEKKKKKDMVHPGAY